MNKFRHHSIKTKIKDQQLFLINAASIFSVRIRLFEKKVVSLPKIENLCIPNLAIFVENPHFTKRETKSSQKARREELTE